MAEALKAGDLVAVKDAMREITKRRVKRVLKRFIELDDGTKWTGIADFYHAYPRQTWGTTSMEPWEDAKHRRPWLLRRLYGLTWKKGWADTLTDEQVVQVLAIIRAAKPSAEESRGSREA